VNRSASRSNARAFGQGIEERTMSVPAGVAASAYPLLTLAKWVIVSNGYLGTRAVAVSDSQTDSPISVLIYVPFRRAVDKNQVAVELFVGLN
jgi:hypothetical protein